MSSRAWYLNVTRADVADRAIVVGDPGRIDLFAEAMAGARLHGGGRALRTVTGTRNGRPVTVCSFGMGAPIAAVVLEELADLGVRTVLRAGTVMSLGDVPMGALVLARDALRAEGTSGLYVSGPDLEAADRVLLRHACAVLDRSRQPYRAGRIASVDGFYTDLVALRPDVRQRVEHRAAQLRRRQVIATDMETSAVLAVGRALGLRAGSLCLCSVDGRSLQRMPARARRAAERTLVDVTLQIISSFEQEES